jgi:hypothetical protein
MLFGEYRIQNAYGLNTTLRYGQNFSSARAEGDPLKWQEFEAYLGFRWLM